jgi:hypothetical protein
LFRNIRFRGAFFALHFRHRGAWLHQKVIAGLSAGLATLIGFLFAIGSAIAIPDGVLNGEDFNLAEVHLACAGIIGTALALILTLSIVPAQKAADVFSAAILKLYARDRHTFFVFALLTILVLTSVLFGTNWIHGAEARYSLAAQFVIVGAALDALRAFYNRTLDLLVPATALGLVKKECERFIEKMKRQIDELARVHQLSGQFGDRKDIPIYRWAVYTNAQVSRPLIDWTHQLEEFSHKAIERRDTQATLDIIATMTSIGAKYADSRRDSLVLTPDFSGPMPLSVSDVGEVLNPIYEGLKNICDDAAKHPNEAVVIGCMRAFGRMAVHGMTMVHVDEWGGRTAPLAYSPVFYLEVCAEKAIQAGMDDALLAAVQSVGEIMGKMSNEIHTVEMEATAIDCLYKIAVSAYPRQSVVTGFTAVKMMLLAARKEIQVRGFRPASILTTVLPKIAALVPVEVQMDKARQRVLQTFPPYALGFEANIPKLLAEVARQIEPVAADRPWVDPFNDFAEASKEVVHHLRDVADKVKFDGVLLQKWILDSIIAAAGIHVHLLANPPAGGDRFLDTVDNRLQWFIYTPSWFFREAPFHSQYATEVAGGLAILGMKLLKLGRMEAAQACAKEIAAIGRQACEAATGNAWHAADVLVQLEQLARAGEALNYGLFAEMARKAVARPDGIADDALPRYQEAITTRVRQLDERLQERGRHHSMPNDPTPLLRDILVSGRTFDSQQARPGAE